MCTTAYLNIQQYWLIAICILYKIRFEYMGWHHLWYVKGQTLLSIRKSYTLFLLSDNQLFELYHLCLEVHCIRYELRLFMAKSFPLLKLIMTGTGWGAVSTIFKVFGMIRTRSRNLPIHIRVCYYLAKSAGL